MTTPLDLRYARLLLPKGYGFPLLLPSPPDDLPDTVKRNGTQIGDVGIVCNDGSFDTIFNICRPEGDPANRFGVPVDFEHLSLLPQDELHRQTLFLSPGTVIYNSASSAPLAEGPAFTETALLRLPDGASTWDLCGPQIQLFRGYALKHAHSWYPFVNNDLGRIVGNSGLYLVTGVTKSTSWSIDVRSVADGETTGWDDASATINSGPHRPAGEESWPENQTVFIRGFKVALHPSSTAAGCDDIEDEESPIQSTYHPSEIINQSVFNSDSNAMVAVTHDDEWISVLKEEEAAIPNAEELMARIEKKRSAFMFGGIRDDERSTPRIHSKHSSKVFFARMRQVRIVSAVKVALKALQASADAFPPLKSAASTALLLMEMCERIKSNKGKCQHLAERAAQIPQEIRRQTNGLNVELPAEVEGSVLEIETAFVRQYARKNSRDFAKFAQEIGDQGLLFSASLVVYMQLRTEGAAYPSDWENAVFAERDRSGTGTIGGWWSAEWAELLVKVILEQRAGVAHSNVGGVDLVQCRCGMHEHEPLNNCADTCTSLETHAGPPPDYPM